MKRRTLALLLALVLCLSALPLTASAAGFTRTRTYNGQFTDVPANAYYSTAVKDCYELGIISGTSDTKFSPNSMYIVRDALVVAARMHSLSHGGTGELPKSDPWYQSAIDYCVNNGIITKDQFSSYKRSVTRAEMAMLLVRALPESTWTNTYNITALPDVSSTTDYSVEIFKLYRAGILQGNDDFGTFNPYGYITRAQVAAMIQRSALPERRVVVALKPLSQRDAPQIIGDLSSYYWRVSNGLMRYRDPTNRLYGYMDANTGAVRIQPEFYDASDFVNGYARVRNRDGLWGIIDTKGTVTLPLSYRYVDDLGYGVYSARVDYSSMRAVVVNGVAVTKFLYHDVRCNGIYIFGCNGENSWDIMNMDGSKLSHVSGRLEWAKLDPLFKVRDGNKYALANERGLITEAIYDRIDIWEGTSLVTAKIGNQEAILGPGGQVKDLGLGEYSEQNINGEYALIRKPESGYAIADANGIRSEFSGRGGNRLVIWGDVLLSTNWGNGICFVYDQSTGKTQSAEGDTRNGYTLLEDGTYVIADGTHCVSVSDLGNRYYSFITESGKHGLLHDGKVASQGIYASEEEAIEAYDYYKQTNENGKPVVLVGNDKKGFPYGIHYYKNELYYDEIKAVGEGYYACRYNTTWYLLHA